MLMTRDKRTLGETLTYFLYFSKVEGFLPGLLTTWYELVCSWPAVIPIVSPDREDAARGGVARIDVLRISDEAVL